MKKIIIFIICFLFINNVYGSTTIQKGTFSKCVDGDTAYFIIDGKEEKEESFRIYEEYLHNIINGNIKRAPKPYKVWLEKYETEEQ